MKNGMPHRFTLIELLVTVAILSILAAILLPALTKAKESAKSVNCLSTIKQLGTIGTMYVDDFEGFMPPYWDCSNPSDCHSWNRKLHRTGYAPYGDGKHSECVLACPYAEAWGFYGNWWSVNGLNEWGRKCYGLPVSSGWTNVLKEVTSPEESVMFADSGEQAASPDEIYQAYYLHQASGSSGYRITTRHQNRANIAFVDGHVGALNATALLTGDGVKDMSSTSRQGDGTWWGWNILTGDNVLMSRY